MIGMMGAGKSTVGRPLAAGCGFDFIDCDRELEQRAGVLIPTMFELEGEAVFRHRESQLLDELTGRPHVVLATGGGVILSEHNRQLLRSRGLVIYLQASVEEIARRTRGDTSRPLLQVADRNARIAQLLEEREPLYRHTAHLVFRSAAANPRRLVTRLLAHPQITEIVASKTLGGS